jgi:two-component system CheB/CheR fusion protein
MFSGFRKPTLPKILLVDDNVAAAQTMAMLLGMNGYEVVVADNGASALREFERMRPDIVLLDIGLPDINGHEVAKRMRACSGSVAPVLVAVTGWEREDMHSGCGDCTEFDFFLTKPINFDDLDGILQGRVSGEGQAPVAPL